MGQKVCPIGLRLGIVEDWRSRWYADKKTFGHYLVEDQKIRRMIQGQYGFAGVSKIEIERTKDQIRVYVYCSRPGLIIGRKGAELERLRGDIETLTQRKVEINIREVEQPETDAQLVAQNIADQLLKRFPFRRVLRKTLESARQNNVRGLKVRISGRLMGSDIARSEKLVHGSVPLHTLRAKIDYGFTYVVTTYGTIGVKVWIYKGMVSEEEAHGPHAKKGQVQKAAAG